MATRQAYDRLLCISRTYNVPLRYILGPLRERIAVRVLLWDTSAQDGGQPSQDRAATGDHDAHGYAHEFHVGRRRGAREYPLTVTVVSPRMLWDLLRSPEAIVLARELNLGTLYAVLSKIRRGRRVIALIEGDFSLLGTTGSASYKVALRRLVARFVDAFVANSAGATAYLTDVLGVPRRRIVEGWWLAGIPGGLDDTTPPAARRRAESPVLLAAGQLIPRKGFDLLLDGLARYRADVGPFVLHLAGDGPERNALEAQASRLGLDGCVEFLGAVPPERMEKLLRSCDLLVFPTLYDLVGRIAVEALSVGTPVAASKLSGAAELLVRDDVNGVLMDPRDPAALADALRRATDPETHLRLMQGARATAPRVAPEAAARHIFSAVELVRGTPAPGPSDDGTAH